MPKGKEAKGCQVTLQMARKAIRLTPEGYRRLVLSNMGIIIFPKCILKLTEVDELDLSRNQIQKLPESLGNFSSLRWLDLHSNKLESVPESIGKLRGLTHLNLSNNCLTSAGLPSGLGSLINLKTLNLGLNKLDDLPPSLADLGGLQDLSLYDNLFINLPDFVKVLKNLTKLNIKRNPMSCVQEEVEIMGDEKMYLVYENSVCRPCYRRITEQRKRVTEEETDLIAEKRIRTYVGLLLPNSIAAVNQDLWRIRQNSKYETAKEIETT